jgi:hypothetical protein
LRRTLERSVLYGDSSSQSLCTVALKKNVTNDLTAGDIISGQMVIVIYDGTNFQTMNIGSGSGTSTGGSSNDHTLIYTTNGF